MRNKLGLPLVCPTLFVLLTSPFTRNFVSPCLRPKFKKHLNEHNSQQEICSRKLMSIHVDSLVSGF